MAFEFATPLFAKVDALTATFATDISGRAITALTPVVSIGLTLSFIVYGLLIIRGGIEMPVMDFLGRSIRIAIITGVALSSGLYQGKIVEAIRSTPDELATALLTNPSAGVGAAALIDRAAGHGFDVVSDAFDKASFYSTDGLAYVVYGVVALIGTAVLVGVGFVLLLVAKLFLSLLAGLGPIFIFALLWQPTTRFFEMWVAQILNYTLLVVLFAAVFGLMMQIFGSYMADIKFDGVQNVAYTLGGVSIMVVAMCVLLLQIQNLASGLAGGVVMGVWNELRSLGRGAKGGTKLGKNLVNNKVTHGAGNLAAKGGAKVMQGAVAGGKASYGYFKGAMARQNGKSMSSGQGSQINKPANRAPKTKNN